LKFIRNLAPLGAVVALACAPSAQAAGGTPVTVRVEGKSRTLVAAKVVHVKSGWLTRYGAPTGACSTASAAGALDVATHHRWGGSFKSSFGDYEILSILGEKTDFVTRYWEMFVGHVMAPLGACNTKAHRGEQLMFVDVPLSDSAVYPLAILGAPRHATAGHAFTVKVVYYDLKGKAHALAGAVVSARGLAGVTTDAHGKATITPAKAGRLDLNARHADTTTGKQTFGYVRAASVRVSVA
jgi:hypothetical protein